MVASRPGSASYYSFLKCSSRARFGAGPRTRSDAPSSVLRHADAEQAILEPPETSSARTVRQMKGVRSYRSSAPRHGSDGFILPSVIGLVTRMVRTCLQWTSPLGSPPGNHPIRVSSFSVSSTLTAGIQAPVPDGWGPKRTGSSNIWESRS